MPEAEPAPAEATEGHHDHVEHGHETGAGCGKCGAECMGHPEDATASADELFSDITELGASNPLEASLAPTSKETEHGMTGCSHVDCSCHSGEASLFGDSVLSDISSNELVPSSVGNTEQQQTYDISNETAGDHSHELVGTAAELSSKSSAANNSTTESPTPEQFSDIDEAKTSEHTSKTETTESTSNGAEAAGGESSKAEAADSRQTAEEATQADHASEAPSNAGGAEAATPSQTEATTEAHVTDQAESISIKSPTESEPNIESTSAATTLETDKVEPATTNAEATDSTEQFAQEPTLEPTIIETEDTTEIDDPAKDDLTETIATHEEAVAGPTEVSSTEEIDQLSETNFETSAEDTLLETNDSEITFTEEKDHTATYEMPLNQNTVDAVTDEDIDAIINQARLELGSDQPEEAPVTTQPENLASLPLDEAEENHTDASEVTSDEFDVDELMANINSLHAEPLAAEPAETITPSDELDIDKSKTDTETVESIEPEPQPTETTELSPEPSLETILASLEAPPAIEQATPHAHEAINEEQISQKAEIISAMIEAVATEAEAITPDVLDTILDKFELRVSGEEHEELMLLLAQGNWKQAREYIAGLLKLRNESEYGQEFIASSKQPLIQQLAQKHIRLINLLRKLLPRTLSSPSE